MIMMKDKKNIYGKALKEVYEVIDNMSVEDTKKISSAFLNKLYKSVDWNYEFEYDGSKSLEEQDISEEAKVILAMVYMRFFADEEEKEEFKNLIKKK